MTLAAPASPSMAAIPVGTSEHRHKRVKLTTSVPAIPDKLALRSMTTTTNTNTPHTSKIADDRESASESELSESSEEPSSESSSDDDSEASDSEDGDENEDESDDEGEDKVINLRANRGKKPDMKLKEDELGPDIRGFLKEFLPKLKAANEELEEQRKAGTLKNREIDAGTDENSQGEQYIEMNLGLGVLEAKTSDAGDSSDSESEDESKEKDILGRLMGRQKDTGAVGIQEIACEDKPKT